MRPRQIIAIFIVGIFALSACSLSVSKPTEAIDANMIATVIAQTLQAQPTIPEVQPTVVSAAIEATSTPPAPTSDSSCDKAEFVTDVSVPDGTVFVRDDAFQKTWRFRNIGSCTWSTGYFIQYENGQLQPQNPKLYLGTNVASGQTVDVTAGYSVVLDPGTYRSNWSLRNANGVIVPISNGVGNVFYTEIKVQSSTGGTGGTAVYRPVANNDCITIKQNIQSHYNVNFSMAIESFTDIYGVKGTACTIRAYGTGDDFVNISAATNTITSAITGYIQDMMYGASGPTGMTTGYRNGNSLATISIHWAPSSDANCPNNQPISSCNLLPSQQLYEVVVNIADK